MKPQTKLAIRRFAIRWSRKLLDFLYESLDDRLHAAEVRLREEIEFSKAAGGHPSAAVSESAGTQKRARANAVLRPQAPRRRRGISASEFDLRFSSQEIPRW